MSRHLKSPLQLAADGSLATLRQDSAAEVAQSVRVLLETRPGSRLAVPAYGTPDQTFDLDVPEIATAIAEWEPRADAEVVATGVEDVRARVDRP